MARATPPPPHASKASPPSAPRARVVFWRREHVADGGVTIQDAAAAVDHTHTYAARITTARTTTNAARRRAARARRGVHADGGGKCDGRALLGRRTRDSIG